MEFWISLLWQLAIVAVVTFVVTFAWVFGARLLAPWDKPFRSDTMSATIRPWPPLWWVMTLLLGAGTFAGAVSGFFIGGSVALMLMMLVISAGFGVLVWFSLLMCLPASWITWNEHSVEGPTSGYSTSRRELAWSDIVRIRRAGGGNVFENAQGQRVVWSDFHIGGRFLWGFLLHKRPDLKQQLDELAGANG